MKGQIISKEFSKIVWVKDNKGSEYSCYIDRDRKVHTTEDLSQNEQKSCMNLNAVLGENW